MKKVLLGAVGAVLALSLAPANADAGNGCQAGPGAPDAGQTCTFTATVAGARYVQATPNFVTIIAERVVDDETVTVELYKKDALDPPGQGTINTLPGDEVTVTMGPDDADPIPVTGSIGIVAVSETE